jgi:uncharacterized membrane protein YhhN
MLLALYGLAALGNVIAAGTGNHVLDWATKPLLMPLLTWWLWRTAGRDAKGILAGLMFSWAGDVALQFDGQLWFITGMLFFLCAHICYITTFLREGARPKAWVVAAYAVALIGSLIVLWKPLGAMALPMSLYALALAAMATLAASVNWRVGLGGMLFLVSDFLIAFRVAETWTVPGPPLWVMLTYTAAQFLIVTGWVERDRSLLGSTA